LHTWQIHRRLNDLMYFFLEIQCKYFYTEEQNRCIKEERAPWDSRVQNEEVEKMFPNLNAFTTNVCDNISKRVVNS